MRLFDYVCLVKMLININLGFSPPIDLEMKFLIFKLYPIMFIVCMEV